MAGRRERYLRDLLLTREARARPNDPYGLGRSYEAEATATHALAEAATALAPHHHRILEIRTLLAHLHNTPEEKQAAAADWAKHFGANHPRTIAARSHV
jgi:hypothetical protein